MSHLLLAAWLGLVATAAAAQPGPTLAYEQALTLAVERAPLLAARRAAVDAAAQGRISASQLPDPKLVVGLDNYPVGGPERYSLTRDGMTQRTLAWMQDVPNAAKRAARAQGAEARVAREGAMLAAEQSAVLREVAQAWLARHFAERQLALFPALEDENQLLRSTLDARIASGKAMPADATMAAQDTLMLADRRDELQRERAKAMASLLRWLGDAATWPLSGGPPTFAPPAVDLAQHTDAQVYAPMAQMAQADIAEAMAMARGDWGWQVGYAKRNSAYGDMVSFAISFELPLWREQRQNPQITARRKDAERIAAEREDFMRRRREELDLQRAEADELAHKRQRLQDSAAPLARQRVSLAMAAYEAGRGELAAVLTARREQVELALRAIELEARMAALLARLSFLSTETRP